MDSTLSPSRLRLCVQAIALAMLFVVAGVRVARAAEVDDARLAALVEQLDADEPEKRDAAERELVAAGKAAADLKAYLARLPTPADAMPAELKLRLERIRSTIEKSTAEEAVAASRTTFNFNATPLSEALAKISADTGNKVVDFREQFGQEPLPVFVTVKADDEEFWPAFDRLLDEANLSPYAYSGEAGLGIVGRDDRELRRSGRAAYSGPFRLEAVSLQSQRGLRIPEESKLNLVLEVAWEPRLAPIALSLDAQSLKTVADDGRAIPLDTEQRVIDVELTPGNFASEITLPLMLPARAAKTLASVKGKLTALTPGKTAEFRYDKLADAEGVEQQSGGVSVTLDKVRKNGELWEVHMRLRMAGEETGLESHRAWVFNNFAMLENKAGEQIENVGMETVVQTESEIGFAYLYEIEGELADYEWVYKTPAAIVTVPIEFQLEDVPLP